MAATDSIIVKQVVETGGQLVTLLACISWDIILFIAQIINESGIYIC